MKIRRSYPIWPAFAMLLRILMHGSAFVASVMMPIILGCAIRFGIPTLTKAAPALQIMSDYASFLDALLYLLTPFFMLRACAMVMVDERDNNTALGLMATPLGRNGYLISRCVLPFCGAMLYTIVITFVFFSISRKPLHTVLIAVTSSFAAFSACSFIPGSARNRLSAASIAKTAFLLLLISTVISFFAPQKWGPYLSWLPTYWVHRYFVFGDWLMAVICVIVSLLWILPSLHTFKHRALRR